MQLKLDNIKYPCEIEDHGEVGRHFVLFSVMIGHCTCKSLCVVVQFIITIFKYYLHLQSKAIVKCLKNNTPCTV